MSFLLSTLPENSYVLLLEADPELRALSHPFWPVHPRLFSLDFSPESWNDFQKRFPWHHVRRVVLVPLTGGWLLNPQLYRDVERRLAEQIAQTWSNRLTLMTFGSLWLRHLATHLAGPRTPWPDWGQDPVLVCGAGPTLETALKALARPDIRARFRVLAVDTALGCFAQAEIRPDAAVVLEAGHHNLMDFAGFAASGLPVFADLTADPSAVRACGGPVVWYSGRFADLPLFSQWEQAGLLHQVALFEALGSVGIAAAHIAWRITRGPVFFTGLDFAFPSGKTHARGAPALQRFWAQTNRLSGGEIPGTGKQEAFRVLPQGWLTTSVLQGYAQLLQEKVTEHADRTFFWGPSPSVSLEALPAEGWVHKLLVLSDPLRWNAPFNVPEAELWRQEERSLTGELLEALSGPYQAENVERLAHHFAHLSMSFPDPDFQASTAWLARLKASAAWWYGLLSPTRLL